MLNKTSILLGAAALCAIATGANAFPSDLDQTAEQAQQMRTSETCDANAASATARATTGVIVAGAAGEFVMKNISCADRNKALGSYRAGLDGRIGQQQNWSAASGQGHGSVTAFRDFTKNGYACREFQTVAGAGGSDRSGMGSACHMSDGDWRLE